MGEKRSFGSKKGGVVRGVQITFLKRKDDVMIT